MILLLIYTIIYVQINSFIKEYTSEQLMLLLAHLVYTINFLHNFLRNIYIMNFFEPGFHHISLGGPQLALQSRLAFYLSLLSEW